MSEFFKSKVGLIFGCIYLLSIFYGISEAFGGKPHSTDSLALLILTAPWSFLLLLLLESAGFVVKENYAMLFLSLAFGGSINASILYLLGCILAWLFSRVPSDRSVGKDH